MNDAKNSKQPPRMADKFRKSLSEQSNLVPQDHPDGNRARPNPDWPPKEGDRTGEKPKQGKEAPAAKASPADKAREEEAATTKGT